MKFSSIKEYFYKLQSRCYALLLLPLGLIILYYLVSSVEKNILKLEADLQMVLRIALPTFALVELTTVHLVLQSKINRIARMPGLGDRLDQFVSIAFIQIAVGVSASITILIGLFLTGDQWFTIAFFVCIAIVILQRPTPANFVRAFKLKGAERELILKGKL